MLASPLARSLSGLVAGATMGMLLYLAPGTPVAAGDIVAQTGPFSAEASDPDAPTFYADVLPILEENCQACHQPAGPSLGGMVAPMSFGTYQETRPWAAAIAEAVQQGRMPPWHASRQHIGTFQNERYLERSEIETLVAWAEAGAPEGAPPPDWTAPEVSEGEEAWVMGEPDLVVRFDEPFCLDDDAHDVYHNVRATLTSDMLPEDRWIKSVEYRPGPHVHHIIQRDWGGLVPGSEPTVYEGGYGRLLQEGPRTVTFDMHYNKTPGPGTAFCDDRTRVGIRFMEEGEEVRFVTGGNQLMMRDFLIPAGDPSYSASMAYEFERDVYITSFMPHAHLRGKAALYEVYYPEGGHETLLHVPDYDFNWQHRYRFREPVFVPEGTTLRFTMWWDNSEDNPHNPDPTRDVTWGLPTYEEMAQGYMQWREVEERRIVVGEPLPDELRRALLGLEEEPDPHDVEGDPHADGS